MPPFGKIAILNSFDDPSRLRTLGYDQMHTQSFPVRPPKSANAQRRFRQKAAAWEFCHSRQPICRGEERQPGSRSIREVFRRLRLRTMDRSQK